MLSVVMLKVVMLSVVAPEGQGSVVDLLIKIACFVTKVSNIFYIKMSSSKLVFTRRSTVLSLPLQ
jgi:hypothetical protein